MHVAQTIENLIRLMAANGAHRIYAKILAPNDNSKNQVYCSPRFEALNLFPVQNIRQVSEGDKPRFKAAVDLWWVDSDHALVKAPGTQLILYPQYPEIRLSGFLQGIGRDQIPDVRSAMTSREANRVLILGICPDGRVIGYVARPDSPIAKQASSLQPSDSSRDVFFEIAINDSLVPTDPRANLVAELARICQKGWIDSKRLDRQGNVVPYHAPNGAGYTLEAELGVTPNGIAKPDFDGWEIKQYGVNSFAASGVRSKKGVITLMTPEPTGGFYKDYGVEAFIRKYGYPDKRNRQDRLNFGGLHHYAVRNIATGLKLDLIGYDRVRDRIIRSDGGLALVSDQQEIAAFWSYSNLMEHWKRKHAQAAYVPSMKRIQPDSGLIAYRYGQFVSFGIGTDILRLLRAVADGKVYYDPGVKLEGASSSSPTIKRRSQFRVGLADLERLYAQLATEDILAINVSHPRTLAN